MGLGIEMFPIVAYPKEAASWVLSVLTLVPFIISIYLFVTTMWFNTFKNRERLPERFWFIAISLFSSFYVFLSLNFIAQPNGGRVSDSMAVMLPLIFNCGATCWFFRSMTEFSLRIGSQKSYGRFPPYMINFYSFFLISLGIIVCAINFKKQAMHRACLAGFGLQNSIFIILLLIVPNFLMIFDILKSDVLALMRTKMMILLAITIVMLLIIALDLFAFFYFALPEEVFDNGNIVGYEVTRRRQQPAGYLIMFGVMDVALPLILLIDQLFLDSILGLVESEETDDAGNSVYLQVTADF